MTATRRDFLVSGLSAGAAFPLLGGGAELAPAWLQGLGNAAPGDQIMVVVQISGGWDFLNMLIAADSTNYYAARPNLGVPKLKTLGRLTASAPVYWHPALAPFKALFDRGDLATVVNVGYPNPNLSHFESFKKWYSADPKATIVRAGWLANWLTKGYTGGFQIPAIDMEVRKSASFAGASVPVLRNVNTFQFLSDPRVPSGSDRKLELARMESNAAVLRPTASPNLAFVAKALSGSFADSRLLRTVGQNYKPRVTYPNTTLARDLQLAAKLITGGLKTEVYYTNLGGWDHHANEVMANDPTQGRLTTQLTTLSGSIKAFLDDLKAWTVDKKVVVMVFSEFGRRFGENGSLGTDHGHGGVTFVAGTPVVGGIYGNYPDLTKATKPFNRYFIPFDGSSTDFRSVYATLLEKWLMVSSSKVLGGTFPLLSFL